MRFKLFAALVACLFALCGAAAQARAGEAQDQTAAGAAAPAATPPADESGRGTRVPLAQASAAFDASGREALSATLLTQSLAGTPDAPARNTRVVVRNATQSFYNYVAGYVTFYDAGGVRCGAGLFTFGAVAAGESVETDTPGLRLTCAPATWRVVATTLLTAAGDDAQTRATTTPPPAPPAPAGEPTTNAAATAPPAAAPNGVVPPLEINVNGKTIPLQLGNPLEIVVGSERVRIVVQPAP